MRGPPGTDTVDGKGQIVHERLTLSLKVKPDSEPPPYRLEPFEQEFSRVTKLRH